MLTTSTLLKPCSGGFVEWELAELNGEGWDDLDNLISEIGQNVELVEWEDWTGTDPRGAIHCESDTCWIRPWMDADGCEHFAAIVAVEEADDPMVAISVRMLSSERERLREIAADELISVSSWIRRQIKYYRRRQEIGDRSLKAFELVIRNRNRNS